MKTLLERYRQLNDLVKSIMWTAIGTSLIAAIMGFVDGVRGVLTFLFVFAVLGVGIIILYSFNNAVEYFERWERDRKFYKE